MWTRRSNYLLLFQLFLSLSLLIFDSHGTLALAEDAVHDLESPFNPDFVPNEKQRENFKTQGGNDLVHEVWSALREIDSSSKHYVTSSSSSAVIDSLWHYLKLAFRTLFMNTPAQQGTSDNDDSPNLSGSLRKGIEALKTAAAFDDPDAIFLLAEMNFHGNFSNPRSPQEAQKWYLRLTELTGNSTAYYILGLMHSTGIGGVLRDQARALMYHTFAAEQGNIRSEMTLAFRHHAGIGTPKDCDTAVAYYKRVADKVMAYWQSGPPGGRMFTRNSYRWVEVNGGIYGEGASASSSGYNAPGPGVTTSSFDDMLEYMDMRERQGDYNAILTLGKYYYEAPRGYKRNLRRAKQKFFKIAKLFWTKDGKINHKAPKGIEKIAGKAAAYIGRMFLRGEGTEQSYETALLWFRRGITQGDSFAQYQLGLMYQDGLGVPKDGTRAGTLLKEAAEQGLPQAQSALGVLFLDQGDLETAGRYFELAASAGVMEGFYYLAELSSHGIGRERNCGLGAIYYKVVAEKAENLHSSILEANAAYERGDLERAFIPSVMAAEQGYENAQANVAYLLDEKTSAIRLPSISLSPSSPKSPFFPNPELALAYYTRSANQANVDSLVKMGDYYLAGDGIPFANTNTTTAIPHPDLEKATTCYTSAAEGPHSAQALWNLGWMHENGIGAVTQDFHMAKRYYDLAYETNKEAYLPVKLALAKLRLRSWWNDVSGGTINPIRDEDDDTEVINDVDEDGNVRQRRKRRPKSFSEWITRFLEEAEEMDQNEQYQRVDDEGNDLDLYASEPGMPGGDAEYANRGVGAGGGGAEEWDDLDDGLVESLIIIALAGALAMLVYARQARQRRLEQEQGQRAGVVGMNPNPNPNVNANGNANANVGGDRDRGFFPQPGDPEINNWVAGGIGH